MKKRILILSFSIFGLLSCNRQQNGEDNLIYKIHVDKSGDAIREGDYVVLTSIEKTEEDSILYNSYENDRPVLLLREKPMFKGDFNTALGLLSEGDSATFRINIDSLTKTDRSRVINTKGRYLIYTVKIEKVIRRGKLNDSVFNNNIEAFHKARLAAAEKNEPAKISSYIFSHNLKPIVTKSGLNYIILRGGVGFKPLLKDTVVINYTGKLLTGKIFDTSDSVVAKKNKIYNKLLNYGPLKLAVVDKPISGFQEALGMFPRGTKAELIIPSKLAYGSQGSHAVQPYTPILCEIEIIDIVPSH